MPKLPVIDRRHKICVICEGNEDDSYFNRLIELDLWNSIYDFNTVNAKGASNIFARFQDAFQNDRYEIILVFCDTDKAPYREYLQTKRKINSFLNKQKAAEKLVIFANPCTMQIILSHFGDVELKNQGKRTNAAVIEKLTGVKNYDAHEDQIRAICSQIFQRNYPEMKSRVSKINFADNVSCSTNFIVFLQRFEEDDIKWISDIKKYLKE